MINNFYDQILNAEKEELEFFIILYNELKKIEYDPISIELQFGKISNNKNYLDSLKFENYLISITKILKDINYDKNTKVIRILPSNYKKVIDEFEDKIEIITTHFDRLKNNKTKYKEKRNFDEKNMIEKLKVMYENAPEGYQMTMVHLFGIKYARELEGKSLKRIGIGATGRDFIYVEIGKGIKLSKYVTIIE